MKSLLAVLALIILSVNASALPECSHVLELSVEGFGPVTLNGNDYWIELEGVRTVSPPQIDLLIQGPTVQAELLTEHNVVSLDGSDYHLQLKEFQEYYGEYMIELCVHEGPDLSILVGDIVGTDGGGCPSEIEFPAENDGPVEAENVQGIVDVISKTTYDVCMLDDKVTYPGILPGGTEDPRSPYKLKFCGKEGYHTYGLSYDRTILWEYNNNDFFKADSGFVYFTCTPTCGQAEFMITEAASTEYGPEGYPKTLAIQLKNIGEEITFNTKTQLTANTPGITIAQGVGDYGTMEPGEAKQSETLYEVSVDTDSIFLDYTLELEYTECPDTDSTLYTRTLHFQTPNRNKPNIRITRFTITPHT
ncbi:hypothetical protein ACFLRF_03470 [Candidatus Altiarchaeota archaeon]